MCAVLFCKDIAFAFFFLIKQMSYGKPGEGRKMVHPCLSLLQ